MPRTWIAIAWWASLCSTAFAGPKEDALQVVDKWAKAFAGSKTVVVAPEGWCHRIGYGDRGA